MYVDFRTGWLVGLVLTLTIGLYCVWLWQPQRQIDRHTKKLFHEIEQRNWSRVADLIGTDYTDQWGNDRALVLERMRLVLGYAHHLRLEVIDANGKIDPPKSASRTDSSGGEDGFAVANNGIGIWRGRIAIESDDAELVAMVK